MTNGTSQGLFIVVAVVIFGLFTLISYLLFQDSLRPKLTSIFDNSLTQSQEVLQYRKLSNNLILEKNMTVFTSPDSPLDFEKDFVTVQGDKTIIKSTGYKPMFRGIRITNVDLHLGKQYVLKYKVRVVSGSLDNFGGHLRIPNTFQINGLNVNRPYANYGGLPSNLLKTSFEVEVLFTPQTEEQIKDFKAEGVYIQPNRGLNEGEFEVEVSDLGIYQILK